MSERCHLRGCKPSKLVELKEEANEVGGYFVMNGIERCVRLLQVPRRNYATAIQRSSYKNRGSSYSDRGVAMRCVRQDQSSVTITLHYLNNGGATLKFVLRKQEFLLPVVIVAKALMDITDKELFDRVAQGDLTNTFMTARLELLLRDAKSYNCNTKAECASFLGSHFRGFLPCSDRTSDEEAGYLLLERYIYVHATEPAEKLECLLHMLRKLFSFAQGNFIIIHLLFAFIFIFQSILVDG
jgi:DNA-directed RNA polymerase I subunit RPA2